MKTAVLNNNQYFHTYCSCMLLGNHVEAPGLLQKQWLANRNHESYDGGTGTEIFANNCIDFQI